MISAFPETTTFLTILAIFLLAGTVKGSLGIGFPAIVMSILPIIVEPALGVALLAIPIFVTNGAQFLTVTGWPAITRRFLIAGISVAVTIFVVVQFVDDVPSRWINIAVGVSLVLFALTSLLKLELRMTEHPAWQFVAGITSGLIGGLSAVKAPIMIYTVGLKLPREEFICAAGFLFFMGGIGLTLGTLSASLLNGVTTLFSLICCAVALVGFRIGAMIRKRLSDKVFRTTILWVILALGLRLIFTNVL
ncbi:MAG: sulfite exporter TauE/SafE family protein [Paracoccaceae bacterium]|nr:sulfite exporter TauE/SafE family protein [Paracoccaceae bacterium]